MLLLTGCDDNTDYFNKVTSEETVTIPDYVQDEIITTEEIKDTTEGIQIFPDSVYDYDVEDTILVPKD